jgi:hypothetical protein
MPRTPDSASADLKRLLEYYLAGWRAERVILIGYSHGADLAPFMVSRLPPQLRSRIALLAMLGLEHSASFRFHLANIIANVSHEDACLSCLRSRSWEGCRCSACRGRTRRTRSVHRCRRRWPGSRLGRVGTGSPEAKDASWLA